MRITPFIIAGAALTLAACGSDEPAAGTTTPSGGTVAGTPAAMETTSADAIVALEMTEAQLRDADLKDMAGRDLGDVEEVIRDSGGQVTHLLVEIDDASPDRFVEVPLAGLSRVADGDDWDVQADLNREALMAMPEVARRR